MFGSDEPGSIVTVVMAPTVEGTARDSRIVWPVSIALSGKSLLEDNQHNTSTKLTNERPLPSKDTDNHYQRILGTVPTRRLTVVAGGGA